MTPLRRCAWCHEWSRDTTPVCPGWWHRMLLGHWQASTPCGWQCADCAAWDAYLSRKNIYDHP